IFDPVVLALAFFVVLEHHGLRQAVRTTGTLFAGLVIGLTLVVGLAPPSYLTGIVSTTLGRARGNTPPLAVLQQALNWVGSIAFLASLGVLVAGVLAWRRKLTWATAGVLAVLAVAILLVPANQARIHTAISLNKHVTFGAWFGAIAAGWLLTRFARRTPVDVLRGG